jgi:hypothetical protein
MKTTEKNLRSHNFLNETFRGFLAVLLSLLLIPAGQQVMFAQDPNGPPPPPPAGNYAPLGAEQLNQLVAPIALYPDSLVAQILTGATYPQQIMDADNWMRMNGRMPPQQLAATVDTMPWDPSVKALTAFPSVLSNLARNNNWAAALGNAYYNQPGDVMNAVQAMRMQAQAAGTLRTDAHYRVYNNAGLVVIDPINPAFVYVPYYNPWVVYGGPIVPWRGYYWGGPPAGVVIAGIGLGFGVGISLGLFTHYGWGYHNWSPNWHGGVVVYNHTTYISRSTTVINRGSFGGYNRGVYEHAGPGVPHNFRPPVTASSAQFRPGQGRPGEFSGSRYSNGRTPGPTTGQQFGQPRTPTTGGQPGQTGGRQFGQNNRPANQPSTPAGNYNRPQTPYRPPTTTGGSTTPQVSRPNNPGTYRPQGNQGTYRPQGGTSTPPSHTPSTPHNSPAPTTARPSGQSHAPAASHQSSPSHSSGGGNHSQQHKVR